MHTDIKYEEISEVFECIKGTIQSSKIENIDDGKYSFVTGAEDFKFKKINSVENHILINGENLFISHRGNGDSRPVKYYKGECYYSDLLTLLIPKIHINIKFAYYYLKFNQKHIEENYQKGACNKTLDFTLFNKMQIPVPPIEVQNLIVRELDSMYKQKESLQNANNEMNAYRKVQFEMLLSKCKDVQNVKLDDIVLMKAGKFNSGNKLTKGKYKFFTSDAIQPSGYYDEYCFEADEYLILIKDGGSGEKNYGDNIGLGKNFLIKHEKTAATSHQLALYMKEDYKNLINYLHKYLLIEKNSIMDLAHYTNGLGCISMEKLKNYEMQLPSIKDQELIILQMEKYDNLVTLSQSQIEEIDTTIKARFEFHLNKCKESKPTQFKNNETDTLEDELSNDSTIKTIKTKQLTKSSITKETNDDMEAELETLAPNTPNTPNTSNTKRPKDKIKIIEDEVSNKSVKSVNTPIKQKNPIKTSKVIIKSTQKEPEPEPEPIETVIVGKVECINESGNYYKFVNGKKAELYAKTSNGKVVLHKKPVIKKVETMDDDLVEMEKELSNIPKN
jgi:type I restriction enzyme S subunit